MESADPRFFENFMNSGRRSLRMLCNLSEEALRRLEATGINVALPRRVIAFSEGEFPRAVFVVCEGQLKLSTASDGQTFILRLSNSGDFLGLSAVLNNIPYEVTAETLEPTTVRSIGRVEFLEFLRGFGEVDSVAAQVMAKEYRELFLYSRRLTLSGPATGRLARLLLDWGEAASGGQQEMPFNMTLTHEELANIAGTSRETVTRVLNQLERNHLISRHGVSLVIINPEELARLAYELRFHDPG